MLVELEQNGFPLLSEFQPGLSTIEVASRLGTVMGVEELLPSSGISTVQRLNPRPSSEVRENQYSGHYGLGEFPMHTDLAHWAVPPRYFILRCVVPADDVCTRILPWVNVTPALGAINMRKAVFAGRKKRIGCSGLVRALMDVGGIEVRRWDRVFLIALNDHARNLARLMSEPRWNETATAIQFRKPGDTLVIDNWRVLHGRSSVTKESTSRLVERVYISEME